MSIKRTAKRLTPIFAMATLYGCATMNTTTEDCMQRQGLNVMGLIATRSDSFNESCATARAAQVIAGMRKSDGTPDLEAYALTLNIYQESNKSVRDFMDKMLMRREGKDIEEIRFEVEKAEEQDNSPVCKKIGVRQENGKVVSSFQCLPGLKTL